MITTVCNDGWDPNLMVSLHNPASVSGFLCQYLCLDGVSSDRQKLNTAYLNLNRNVCETEDARFNDDKRKTVRRTDRGQLWAPPVAQAKADLQGFKSQHRPLTNTQAWPSQIKSIV